MSEVKDLHDEIKIWRQHMKECRSGLNE